MTINISKRMKWLLIGVAVAVLGGCFATLTFPNPVGIIGAFVALGGVLLAILMVVNWVVEDMGW